MNNFFQRSRSGLLFTDISDHLSVFSVHSDCTLVNRCRLDPVFVGEKNPDKILLFVERLEGVDWSSLYDCENPNIVYNRFLELCTEICNDCFPLKKVSPKWRRLKKPGLTKAHLKSIRKKIYTFIKDIFVFPQWTMIYVMNHTKTD